MTLDLSSRAQEEAGAAGVLTTAGVPALLDGIRDPIVMLDTAGRMEIANPAYRQLMADAGVQDGPLSASPELVLPRDRNGRPVRAGEALARALDGKESQYERVFRMADGRDRTFAVTGSPVRAADGSVVGVAVVLHDLTRRQHQERALRLLDEVRRGLSLAGNLRHAARVVCRRLIGSLSWVDMAAVYLNEGEDLVLLAHLGFPGRAAKLLQAGSVGPGRRPAVAASDDQITVFHAERDEPDSEWSRRLVVASGASTFVNLPLTAGVERFGLLTLAGREPHEPTRAQQTLLETLAAQLGAELEAVRRRDEAESERARLQAVLDQLPEGVLLFDAAGRLKMTNRRSVEILGQEADPSVPVIGLAARYGFFQADGRPYQAADHPLVEVFRSGRPVLGVEQLVRRPDGRELPLVTNVAPVRDALGRLTAVIFVFQDITNLREMDRTKDEFLSIAGHELRTPITSIRGLAQMLQRRLDDPATLQVLAAIKEQTDQMTALVDELLDVSRIRTGKLPLQLADCDLSALVAAAVESARAQHDGSIDLVVEGDMLVNGDPARLRQVFANLLSNAIKYSRRTAPIAVRAVRRGNRAVVSVADRGIGIAPEDVDRIFQRFYRAPAAVDRADGLGLGLYLCNEILERHGGSIAVESVPGQGSTFTVSLPAMPEEQRG